MVAIFRFIVAFSTALFVLVFLRPIVAGSTYSEEGLALLSWNTAEAIWIPTIGFSNVLFASWIGVSLALFFFVRGAHHVFAAMVVGGTILFSLTGYQVMSPLDSAAWYLVQLSDGAILVMCYLTSINERFRNEGDT